MNEAVNDETKATIPLLWRDRVSVLDKD